MWLEHHAGGIDMMGLGNGWMAVFFNNGRVFLNYGAKWITDLVDEEVEELMVMRQRLNDELT